MAAPNFAPSFATSFVRNHISRIFSLYLKKDSTPFKKDLFHFKENFINFLTMTKHDNSTPIAESSARIKALQAAMRQIEKDFGQGSVMFLGQQPTEPIEVIPTGSMALNSALGIGGYPRGRIVEIYGGEASGKTTLALHAIAEVQRMGGTALFVDAEHAFDPRYAAQLGIDVKALLVAQPDCGEDALDITDTLIRSSAIDLVVVDSVAALTPKAELEGEMGDNKLGLQARLMSQALRKITASLAKTRTTCIFINQLREKINVTFGNPEVTTGGHALKFYASLRLDVRRFSNIKKDGRDIGAMTRVKVVKNKMAPPFRSCEFELIFGHGISHLGELLQLGLALKVIYKTGAWYSLGDRHIAMGREAFLQALADNSDLRHDIEARIVEQLSKSDTIEEFDWAFLDKPRNISSPF